MGSWFSNLHIKKNSLLSAEEISAQLREWILARQYVLVSDKEEADGAFAIVTNGDSHWFSLYSDLFCFEDPKQFAVCADAMSRKWNTEVLGISCFDSDYLYLNLIHSEKKLDAWAGVGTSAGLRIRRRTALAPWKKCVDDFPLFQTAVRQNYVFAEEVLAAIEPCLHLPRELAAASYEYLEEWKETAQYLCFKLPEMMEPKELPKLRPHMSSLMPCYIGKYATVNALNTGGASRGLSIYFLGPYVEHDEITFTDVSLLKWKNNEVTPTPIELTKIRLEDGQWAYFYHDPGFRIPEKVDDRLPLSKRMRVERDREIIVRFVPQGDSRKILDITVALVPDKNPGGSRVWNVWQSFGSKNAFLEMHNSTWSRLPTGQNMVLKESDFDL